MNITNINFENLKKVHFIGIGGISMSAIAEILISKGINVTGSDRQESNVTKHLSLIGAYIVYEQVAVNITDDIDLVVYTAAISNDNEELVEAGNRRIPTMVRADFLGLLMKEYQSAICVSGTHGKTTTTSMIAHVLMEDTDPTILVGGILDSIGGNLRLGKSGDFLTEACEYTNSFLSFFPTTAVVLNICEDHMDFFKDIDDIRNSFKKFVELVPEDGCLVINGDIPQVEFFTEGLKCKVVTFGIDKEKNNLSADNIEIDEKACCNYDLIVNGENRGRVKLSVTGVHNVYNSLSAIAIGMNNGMTIEKIVTGLKSYIGTKRRFELKGSFNEVIVVDDYAHHPDEIKATLMTAKNYKHKDLWVVFQPHTFSRTKAFLKEFGKALSLADHVVLTEIYAAREKDNKEVSSEDILKELQKLGVDSYYLRTFEEIENFVKEKCLPNDLLITMGAGNIVNVGENLIRK